MKYKKIFFDVAIIAILLLIIVIGRWDSIIYPLSLSPDEAQMAANTLRIRSHGFNWDSLDGTTSGPLNSLVLAWPHLIGFDTTFALTRLTGCALLSFTCLFTYLTIATMSGTLAGILYAIPLALFYSLTESTEFLHYSSEVLPLFLLILANYIATKISTNNSSANRLNFFFLGILLGAIPFAKLQATPIALLIGLYGLYLAYIKSDIFKRLKNTLAIIGGGIGPALIILLPLYFSGHILDFWNSYILWAFSYVHSPISILDIHTMIASDWAMMYVSYFLILSGAVSGLCLYCFIKSKNTEHTIKSMNVFYMACLIVAIVYSISRPGNLFPHYLMFLTPFLSIFFGYIFSTNSSQPNIKKSLVISYLVIFLCFILHPPKEFLAKDLSNIHTKFNTVLQYNVSVKNPALFSWIPSTLNSLLIWGWMPQWYLLANLSPATRESHTYSQITKTNFIGYFRERFIKDFESSDPDIVLDSVNGKSFGFNEPQIYSPSSFPEFSKILEKKYSLLSNSLAQQNKCPRLYVKNDIKKLIEENIIIPKDVHVSETYGGADTLYHKENLFDLSTTEDTCIDFWLLPDNKLGNIIINFNKAEVISKLMILNTQNSNHLDRSTKTIRLSFYKNNKLLLQSNVEVKAYPYWTSINLTKPVISDRIELDIISFFGRGAGLNELKIFRVLN